MHSRWNHVAFFDITTPWRLRLEEFVVIAQHKMWPCCQVKHRRRLEGAVRARAPPIIEKRLWFHQLLQPLSPIFWFPLPNIIIFTSVRQWSDVAIVNQDSWHKSQGAVASLTMFVAARSCRLLRIGILEIEKTMGFNTASCVITSSYREIWRLRSNPGEVATLDWRERWQP